MTTLATGLTITEFLADYAAEQGRSLDPEMHDICVTALERVARENDGQLPAVLEREMQAALSVVLAETLSAHEEPVDHDAYIEAYYFGPEGSPLAPSRHAEETDECLRRILRRSDYEDLLGVFRLEPWCADELLHVLEALPDNFEHLPALLQPRDSQRFDQLAADYRWHHGAMYSAEDIAQSIRGSLRRLAGSTIFTSLLVRAQYER